MDPPRAVQHSAAPSVHEIQVLIIEDVRETSACLTAAGNTNHRLSHYELMTGVGQEYFNKLYYKEYNVLWISLPHNYYNRTPPPIESPCRKRWANHWTKLQHWVRTANKIRTPIFLFGQPGVSWKPFEDTLQDEAFCRRNLQLCSLGIKFDTSRDAPSRAYFVLASNLTIPRNWDCHCKCTVAAHVKDWYGNTQQHGDFRRRARQQMVCAIWPILCTAIQDRASPPLPTQGTQKQIAYPTEARIAQKERLKQMKEKGEKPKKKKKIVEPGNDDCGDDLSGLGKDIVLLSCDWDNDWTEAYPTTRKELRQGNQPSSSSASRQTDRPRETVERPSSDNVVPDAPGPRIIPPPLVPTGLSFTRPGP